MKRILVATLLLLACGDQSTFEIVADPWSVPPPPSYTPPSPPPPPSSEPRAPSSRCEPSAPFGVPSLVPGLEGRNGERASLDGDEMRLAFTELGIDEPKILLALRTSRAQPFTVVGALTIYDVPGAADLDLHDEAGVFASNRSGSGFDLFRRTPDAIEPLPLASDPQADDRQPFAAGGRLVFSSNRSGDFALWEGPIDGTPSRVVELDTPGFEGHPVLGADGLRIYFSSDRPGVYGGTDVWTAERASPTSPFGPPARVPGVNGIHDDAPSFVSTDECRLYLTRTIGARSALYVAERPRN